MSVCRPPLPAGPWAIEPAAFRALNRLLPGPAGSTPSRRPATASPYRAGRTAVVPIRGVMTKGGSEYGGGTAELRRDVRALALDPSVSAILLVVDSPGGESAGTDILAQEVRAAARRKPTWAFVEDLCASAAYWVACQCEKVYANNRTALVGSIGTFWGMYDQSAMFDRAGVKPLLFTTGRLKGAGALPGAAIVDDHKAEFQGLVNAVQAEFDAAVKRGRGFSDRQLAAVRTGGIFSAPEAERLRLIDGIQSLDKTLAGLRAAAGK